MATSSPPTTSTSSTTSGSPTTSAMNPITNPGKTLLDIPPEIRVLIFEHTIRDCAFPPNVLMAFEKNGPRELYEEASEVFTRVCHRIDCHNEEIFNQQPMTLLWKVEHARFVAPLRFRAQKITCMSNLKNIILDWLEIYNEDRRIRMLEGTRTPSVGPDQLAQMLIPASKNVRRVVFKARENSINRVILAIIWCRIEKAISLPQTKEITADGLTTWIWRLRREDQHSNGSPMVDKEIRPYLNSRQSFSQQIKLFSENL